jgi:hypothetical protein
MANIYHPKGSMCVVCRNKRLPCHKALKFNYMPVMSQYSQANDENVYKIVKCIMFNKI